MECPVCGHEVTLDEKDTSSGRDMRTYRCRQCGGPEDVDYGIALWQVLSDAREAAESQSARPGDQAHRTAGGKRQKIFQIIRALWRGNRGRS